MKETRLLDEVLSFNEGKHIHIYKILGAHRDGDGVRFSVWAPCAKGVAVVGDFSNWEPIWMEPLFQSGVWVAHVNNVYEGNHYKYLIVDQNDNHHMKIDPFAQKFEMPPQNASIIYFEPEFIWTDEAWYEQNKAVDSDSRPLNIYEVHASSWMRHYDGSAYSFYELADKLVPYVKEMGYTHIEFMPLMEHPLDASWGYQITGYFAVASRYGDKQGLRHFVNEAHRNGIGVILDWVPGHFCQNSDALASFDGTNTFEYQNEICAMNQRWGARNFDLGRNEVKSFLFSSAMYWIHEFHVDGIRVDAVSNMLYLDYDLPPHVLNEDGTNINHKGVKFLKELNHLIHTETTAFTVAEESTAWNGITKNTGETGLGFDYKWNMGWMNDILRFFELDPLYRVHHMQLATFVFMYQYNERYILALSHDEVVHGKRSLLAKMPGDRYNQFAQLKVLYGLMMFLPGKKLNFMGNELGQYLEWRYYEELEWGVLGYEYNREYQHFVRTLNYLYLENDEFYELEYQPEGLTILQASHDNPLIIALKRNSSKRSIYAVINLEPIEHKAHRVGVSNLGEYSIRINSESREFGGSWVWYDQNVKAEEVPHDSQPYSVELVVPAYGVLILERK